MTATKSNTNNIKQGQKNLIIKINFSTQKID